jgi:hypothetical protein
LSNDMACCSVKCVSWVFVINASCIRNANLPGSPRSRLRRQGTPESHGFPRPIFEGVHAFLVPRCIEKPHDFVLHQHANPACTFSGDTPSHPHTPIPPPPPCPPSLRRYSNCRIPGGRGGEGEWRGGGRRGGGGSTEHVFKTSKTNSKTLLFSMEPILMNRGWFV